MAPESTAPQIRLGGYSDICAQGESSAFLLTNDRVHVDSLLRPAVELARAHGLFDELPERMRLVVDLVLDTDDLVSKRCLWMGLLLCLPAMQVWLVELEPVRAPEWIRRLKSSMTSFTTGQCYTLQQEPSGAARSATARKKRRYADAKGMGTPACSPAEIYTNVSEFVYMQSAYMFAL